MTEVFNQHLDKPTELENLIKLRDNAEMELSGLMSRGKLGKDQERYAGKLEGKIANYEKQIKRLTNKKSETPLPTSVLIKKELSTQSSQTQEDPKPPFSDSSKEKTKPEDPKKDKSVLVASKGRMIGNFPKIARKETKANGGYEIGPGLQTLLDKNDIELLLEERERLIKKKDKLENYHLPKAEDENARRGILMEQFKSEKNLEVIDKKLNELGYKKPEPIKKTEEEQIEDLKKMIEDSKKLIAGIENRIAQGDTNPALIRQRDGLKNTLKMAEEKVGLKTSSEDIPSVVSDNVVDDILDQLEIGQLELEFDVPENKTKVSGGAVPNQVDSIQSKKAQEILQKVEKQKIEEMTKEELDRIFNDKLQKGREKWKATKGLWGIVGGSIVNIGLRIQRAFDSKSFEEVRKNIKEIENLIDQDEINYVNDLFRDIADGNIPEATGAQRDAFEKILSNRGFIDKQMQNPVVRRIMDTHLIGNITLGALAGFTAGASFKSSARIMTKMAFGFAGGALAGGIFNGAKEYKKASDAEYNAKKWAEELVADRNLENPEERLNLAAHIQMIEEKLTENGFKKIKGNEANALALMYQIRQKKIDLARFADGKTEGVENIENIEEKFKRVTEILDKREEGQEKSPILDERRREIFNKVMKQKEKAIRDKTLNGIKVGVLIGGGAGSIAALMGHFIDAAEHGGGILAGAGNVNSGAIEHSFAIDSNAAHQYMDTRNFTIEAGKGDGTIMVANKAIHDYVLNQDRMEHSVNGYNVPYDEFDKSHMMAAADILSRKINTGNHYWISAPGDRFTFSAEDIKNALDESNRMNANQLGFFNSHVSEKMWDRFDIQHNTTLFSTQNDFSSHLVDVKNGADFNTLLMHNNPEINSQLMEPIHHVERVVHHTSGTGVTGGTAVEHVISPNEGITVPPVEDQGDIVPHEEVQDKITPPPPPNSEDVIQHGITPPPPGVEHVGSDTNIINENIVKENLLNQKLLGHRISGFGEINPENISIARDIIKRENQMENLVSKFRAGSLDRDSFLDQYERVRVPGKFSSLTEPFQGNANVMEWQRKFDLPNNLFTDSADTDSVNDYLKNKFLDSNVRSQVQ